MKRRTFIKAVPASAAAVGLASHQSPSVATTPAVPVDEIPVVLYATVNMDAKALHNERRPWAAGKMAAHHRVLARAGLANMVLFETGVSAVALFDDDVRRWHARRVPLRSVLPIPTVP